MHENNPSRKRRVLLAAVTFLIFLLFGGICFAAGALIWYQGQEVDVSVDTSGEHFTERVSFSVSNVLGMDILIDEREGSCARLQFYEGGVWLDVCEIEFVSSDSTAVSVKYGGMYAHLAPGAKLEYELNRDLLAVLPSGRYRIAIPYISEESYLTYLQNRAEDIDESLEAERSDDLPQDESEETVSDVSEISEEVSGESAEAELPETEIFYKEFSITNRADGTESKEEPSQGLDVSIDVG
ncbi:MAG: hypothetical protein IJD82_08995 [Clostridia bacterium]|nr:hypothetical protein [Clostridia bacterium]